MEDGPQQPAILVVVVETTIPRANECKTEKAIGSDSLFCCSYKNTSKPLIFEMQTSRTVRISPERRNLIVRVPA